MFADDTQGLASGNNLDQLIDNVNRELKKWAVWFCANKMAVNVSKTKFIIFHNKGKKVDLKGKEITFHSNPSSPSSPPTPLERIHSKHPDPSKRSYKLLGILIDENLSFEYQINSLRNKLSRSIYIINKAKHFLPNKSLRDLYFALFHSHLTYCPIITGCANKTNLDKIATLQKKIIRIVTNSSYRAHSQPLFSQLKILPFFKLIEQSKLLFMHSIHFKYAPLTFKDTWLKNDSRNLSQQLRNSDQYIIPRPKTSSFTRFPLTSLPLSWNNAGDFKYHSNRTTFKIALKNDLLQINDDTTSHLANIDMDLYLNNDAAPPLPPSLPSPTPNTP